MLNRIILFCREPIHLKQFYVQYFGFTVTESDGEDWIVLDTGAAQLALHRFGPDYSHRAAESVPALNPVKLVFEVTTDISQMRQQMADKGASMQEIRSFEGYDYLFCDGADPEGNVFQLMQKKAATL